MDFINNNTYEKRKYIRTDFSLDIHYPLLNNQSIYKDHLGKDPILRAINISETGICFSSRINIRKGDFISFLMKIKNEPSFWCLCEAKWTKQQEKMTLIGCEFYALSLQQLNTIKAYVIAQCTNIFN